MPICVESGHRIHIAGFGNIATMPKMVAVDVIRDISPDDGMFTGNEAHYFGVGESALHCIRCALQAAQLPEAQVLHILDLPCGHGRVMRHLRAAFPAAELAACDLLRDGVDYCARTFDARPVYSSERVEEIPISAHSYDLIWVGSLLTHVDRDRWDQFLNLFSRSLRPGGALVVTTHGRKTAERMARGTMTYGLSEERLTALCDGYEVGGFGFVGYRDSATYGCSLSRPEWVMKRIRRQGALRPVYFAETSWDKHQDVYAAVCEPGWRAWPSAETVWRYLRNSVRRRG